MRCPLGKNWKFKKKATMKKHLWVSLLFFSTHVSNSSEVEQMAVNHLVVGSIPTWGGISRNFFRVFFFFLLFSSFFVYEKGRNRDFEVYGMQPSGKASEFGSDIQRFESFHPSKYVHRKNTFMSRQLSWQSKGLKILVSAVQICLQTNPIFFPQFSNWT